MERAEAGLKQERRTMEAAIRRGHNELRGLIAQEETLERELERAIADLDVVLVNVELGLTTRFEAEQARVAVFQAKQQIERVRFQQWQQTFRLANSSLLN